MCTTAQPQLRVNSAATAACQQRSHSYSFDRGDRDGVCLIDGETSPQGGNGGRGGGGGGRREVTEEGGRNVRHIIQTGPACIYCFYPPLRGVAQEGGC